MRILYAINSAKRGGAENHTLDLAEGMYNRGHEVFVWLPEGPMVEEFKAVGASVVTIKIGFDLDPTYIIALTKFLREKKIDVVHGHELKAVGNVLIAGTLARSKVKISHTHTPISEWRISAIKRFFNIRFFNSPAVNIFSTMEIALTESRKKVKMNEGIMKNKLKIIPNGLKVENFSPSDMQRLQYRQEILSRYDIPQDAYVFGTIGRLSIEKGTDVLVEGFSKFYNSASVDKKKTYLLIAGGGNLKDSLREKIKAENMADNIIMPGVPYDEEDKIKFLSAFDAFVFPSLAEGFGIVLIEAMVMSLPIVCSDLEVLQEVGGSSVVFFETGSSGNLSEKMFNLYEKKDRLSTVGENSRNRVEQLYTMKTFIDNYENLYLELLGTKS